MPPRHSCTLNGWIEFTLSIVMASVGTGLDSSYDEAFLADGAVRPQYLGLQQELGFDPLRPTFELVDKMRNRPLDDDSRILAVPWVLGGADSVALRAGVAQRAVALQRFFSDLASGSEGFLVQGRSPVTNLVDGIIRDQGTSLEAIRQLWQGHAREEISFTYAPDIVRGPDGRWWVLEDNVGCVGGSADSHFVWASYVGAARPTVSAASLSGADLAGAVRSWMDLRDLGPPGVVKALSDCGPTVPPHDAPDIREESRRDLILRQLGVEIRDCSAGISSCADSGSVLGPVVNFHTESSLVVDLFNRHQPLFNAPATGVLGSKALMPYVEDMVRHFCAEEPILATPATRVLSDGKLPAQPRDWVVKSAAGCQGTEVFVLRDQSDAQLEAVRKLVSDSWPDKWFVAQEYIPPSHLTYEASNTRETYRLELRLVSYVIGWDEVHPSWRPLGKAVSSLDVGSLHNLSQGAWYAPCAFADPTT